MPFHCESLELLDGILISSEYVAYCSHITKEIQNRWEKNQRIRLPEISANRRLSKTTFMFKSSLLNEFRPSFALTLFPDLWMQHQLTLYTPVGWWRGVLETSLWYRYPTYTGVCTSQGNVIRNVGSQKGTQLPQISLAGSLLSSVVDPVPHWFWPAGSGSRN